MNPAVTGVQIGRQFWVSNDTAQLAQVMQTPSSTGTTQTQSTQSLQPPDKSFVNFVRGGKGGQFGGAVRAAQAEAYKQLATGGVPSGAQQEQTARTRLNEFVGKNDLDAYVQDLTDRAIRNYPSYSTLDANGQAALKNNVKTALVKLFNMSEVQELLEGKDQGRVSNTEWANALDERLAAVENATLGIVEMIESGKVSADSVLYMNESQVLSVNSYEDLSRVLADTAMAAKKTFIDETRLLELKTSVNKLLAEYEANIDKEMLSPNRADPMKGVARERAESLKEMARARTKAVTTAIDKVIQSRKAAVANLKTAVQTNGTTLTEKELKKELQKISNSTRSFRYSMDCHQNKKEGVLTRIRRFCSNLFYGDSKSKVSDKAFKAIKSAEAELEKALGSFNTARTMSGLRSDYTFAGVETVSAEAGELTHKANSLLRNCSKQVDKSYVAYINRAHTLFDKALKQSRGPTAGVQSFTMTCKLSADIAFDFGIGSGKAGASLKRQVAVMVHPGGKISMRLLKGGDIHANVDISKLSAKAAAEYMEGRVLTFDSFDEFVASAYGNLYLPATDADRAESNSVHRQESGDGPKFLGDTSGNTVKRGFRSIGFLEFGSAVDTKRLLTALHAKGYMTDVKALVNGLDSGQGYVASAKERIVQAGVGAKIDYKSDDGSKAINIGVGVGGTVRFRSNDVETVDVFDLATHVPKEKLEEAFTQQLSSVKENVIKDSSCRFSFLAGGTNPLDKQLASIVKNAKLAPGTPGALSLRDASQQIHDLIGGLQWNALSQAPKGKKDAENFWMGYARCLRACTLAQSVLEKIAVGQSQATADEIGFYAKGIRQAAREMRGLMPREIYDNHVLFGIQTIKEPPRGSIRLKLSADVNIKKKETEESDSSGTDSVDNELIDLKIDGMVTWNLGSKNVDAFRPWTTDKSRYVDLMPENNEVPDKMLKYVAKKALPGGSDADRDALKTKLSDLLTAAGVPVEGVSTSGTTSLSGNLSVRLEFDKTGQITRFSASTRKVDTEETSVGKEHLSVTYSQEAIDENELAATFLQSPLSRIMDDVEELLKGSVTSEIPPSLDTYTATHSKSVVKFCDDLGNPESESAKMLKDVEDFLPGVKEHPRYAKFAEAYQARLTALKGELASSGTHDDAWKRKVGTEFLVLATQTMRLGSMVTNDPWTMDGVFLV